MSSQKPLGAPAHQDTESLRKKVLADPNTERIARNLGVPVADYVEQVVHFALHPEQEPRLYIVEDEDLRAMGLEPPDAQAMERFVTRAASIADAAEGRTEFVEERRDSTRPIK